MECRDLVLLCLVISQYTSSMRNKPSGTGLVGFLVFLNSSLCWNLISPTIPCLRPTALSYATGGVKATIGSSSASRSYNISNNERRSTGIFSQSKILQTDEMPLRPIASRSERNHTSVAPSNEDEETTTTHVQQSEPRRIRITQEFQVTRK